MIEKVNDTNTTELERFWQDLIPMPQGEKTCLHNYGQPGQASMSYKDFYAQAHCAAAYLMGHGLKHGDPVVILSGNTAEYLILDLALQYLGAINITLPQQISPEDLVKICDRYEARFLFVPDAETMHAHGQFAVLKPQLVAIVVGTDEMDGLDTHKLIAFDRLVAIGKTIWREQAGQLKDCKKSVRPSDLYALIFPDNGSHGDFEPLSFMSMVENIKDAQRLFAASSATTAAVTTLSPHRILHRTHATYGAMLARVPFWICIPTHLDAAFFAKVNPTVLYVSPETFADLYKRLPSMMGKDANAVKAASLAIEKAHEVLQKKATAESQGKKNPFFNRMKYKFGSKKTYAKVRVALGGNLTVLACDQGSLERESTLLFTECGIKVEQPKPIL